ncbi:MAG TPA: hypothetical protein VF666_14445 [Pyrinomonadaceae bacterium]
MLAAATTGETKAWATTPVRELPSRSVPQPQRGRRRELRLRASKIRVG